MGPIMSTSSAPSEEILHKLASVAQEVDKSSVKRHGQRIFSHALTYETSQTANPFIETLALLRVCISGEVSYILRIMTI